MNCTPVLGIEQDLHGIFHPPEKQVAFINQPMEVTNGN
jgi:hypothetical protein